MRFPPPTESDIQRVVDLVIETASPLRIVLFGSAARGELRDGSDLDIMVVVAETTDTLRMAQRLHVAMGAQRDLAVCVDFVVTTPARFEQRRDKLGSVYREVARDGRELYAA
jgi:predicted nucleotidyltransferase